MEVHTRYLPSAEQFALAGSMESSIAGLLPLARLHRSSEETADTWSGLADVGVFGICEGEAHGGSGLGAVEESLIVQELGKRLAAPSVVATLGTVHAGSDGRDRIRGRRVAAAWRQGDRTVVVGDDAADLVLVRDPHGAAVYELSNPASLDVVDGRLWAAHLREVPGLGAPIARFDAAGLLRLRLIDAAALAGIAAAALEMAVAYANVREQFGRAIGTFQAVKHHCANMVMAMRSVRDQVSFAAVAVDERRADAALQVECALFAAGTAAIENAGMNIQVHGAIGFSDEANPHHLLKRAQLLVAIAGGLEAANTRIADIDAIVEGP